MAQLDLGRVTLQIRNSRLQLHLSARARLSRLKSNDFPSNENDILRVSDLDGSWVTEAPYMELRFFICKNRALKDAIESLITGLRRKLCHLKIWSELGLSAVLGTEDEQKIDTSGLPCLRVDLKRQNRMRSHKRRWTLPIAMANAPGVCPPKDIFTATLESIDVSLDFCFCNEQFSMSQSSLGYGADFSNTGLPYVGLGFNLEIATVSSIQFSTDGNTHLEEIRQTRSRQPEYLKAQISHTSVDGFNSFHEEFFRLLELGMQRLIISNTIRDPDIRVSKKATLSSLPDVVPAVFEAGHQEAINQRGVTIPIITKAITAMLKGNHDASFESRILNTAQTSHYANVASPEKTSQATGLRDVIHSSLWHIARVAVGKSKPPKKDSVVLSSTPSDDECFTTETIAHSLRLSQQAFDRRIADTRTESQVPPSDEDLFHFGGFLNESDCESDLESQLLDNCSETSFMDIGESTQSSLNTSLSTAISSQTAWSGDESMLFSDGGEVVIHRDSNVRQSYSLETIPTHNADVMMMDGI